MVDFKTLKKNSGANSLLAIQSELEKLTNKSENSNDERFWQPTVDKAGNGYAVIRFLPPTGDEPTAFIRYFRHSFQGPTGLWYIENSLTSLGKDDPVGQFNTELWNTGLESNKKIASKQKRKLTFVSNIYVVSDQGNPDNEGKVFLFRYGKKIFDKLNEVMNPEFPDEQPMNPFDLWEGANLALKVRNVEGYRNYDKSAFLAKGPLLDDDKKLEAIWKSQHSLQEFLDPKNFKTYDVLKARMNLVLANPAKANIPASEAPSLPSRSAAQDVKDEIESAGAGSEDDEDVAFFTKMAAKG